MLNTKNKNEMNNETNKNETNENEIIKQCNDFIEIKKKNYKYKIHENDMKHRTMRYIDPNKVDWIDEKQKERFFNIKHDTLIYRLNECIEANYDSLDLSGLNLKNIPDLKKLIIWNKLKYIKHLFINNNEIYDMSIDFKNFINLKTLDISHNKLTRIINLPDNLEELSCCNNTITDIQSHDKLLRLNCNSNQIIKLNQYLKLNNLICNNNKINTIQSYPELNKLSCVNNPLLKIENQLSLIQLDCSYTRVKNIINCNNLTHLICNNTPINNICNLKKIKMLEMCNCNFTV